MALAEQGREPGADKVRTSEAEGQGGPRGKFETDWDRWVGVVLAPLFCGLI